MTHLELVQDLWRESGSGGPQPAAVTGQTGEALRLVQWIRRAEKAIQAIHTDWNFLWAQTSFNTVASTATYAFPADLGAVDEDSFLLDGETRLECLPYLDVKGEALLSGTGTPHRVVLMPNRTFRLDVTPGAVHSVQYDYYLAPDNMLLENDAESVIPAAYRQLIVARALIMYGRYENAPDAKEAGAGMWEEMYPTFESLHLPGDRDAHGQAEGNRIGVIVE